jgi:hypothetical protein
LCRSRWTKKTKQIVLQVALYDGQYSFRQVENGSNKLTKLHDLGLARTQCLFANARQNELATKGIQHGGHKMSAECKPGKTFSIAASQPPSRV